MTYTPAELAMFKQVYGDKWQKAIRVLAKERANAKAKFLKKHPYADMSKFRFEVDINVNAELVDTIVFYKVDERQSFDITSDTFLNNKKWTKYLNTNEWPEIWSLTNDYPKFADEHMTGKTDSYDILGWTYKDTKYQEFGRLMQPLNDFDVFVADGKSFKANLPVIKQRWTTGKTIGTGLFDLREVKFDYKKDSYFAMLAGMYIASYLSGVSMLNIKDENSPDIVKSIARYHLYYQTRKFMSNPKLIDQYDVTGIASRIPYKHKEYKLTEENSLVALHDVSKRYPVLAGSKIKASIELTDHDYYGAIAYKSNGITAIGQKLLQESIESYVYCILGAQAKTRWSIIDNGAKSTQTQDVFRDLVEATILQSDTTVTLSDMRRAVEDCNVVLNMAISPGVVLVPSSMIILKKPIPGYSNTLTTAMNSMKFGKNAKVNYVGTLSYKPSVHPDKTNHGDVSSALDKIPRGKPKHHDKVTPIVSTGPSEPDSASGKHKIDNGALVGAPQGDDTLEMIGAMVVLGVIIFAASKYVGK